MGDLIAISYLVLAAIVGGFVYSELRAQKDDGAFPVGLAVGLLFPGAILFFLGAGLHRLLTKLKAKVQ